MRKFTYEVYIENVKVGPKFYSFDYKVFLNGRMRKGDSYDSSWSWNGGEGKEIEFKKHLLSGGAAKIALQQLL